VYRGGARTAVKNARHLLETGQIEEAREAVQVAVRALDRAASKGIIHKNNAARRKSRLVHQLNQAESA
jgi:small subunit ribosomal protein S20